jgi:ABC-type glycerol-3-phosphate transport system permease component
VIRHPANVLVVPLYTIFADKGLIVNGTKGLTVAHLTLLRRYFGRSPDPTMKKADLVAFLEKALARASE